LAMTMFVVRMLRSLRMADRLERRMRGRDPPGNEEANKGRSGT
jgi:hypothetical protein